jgi:hypothetical protein
VLCKGLVEWLLGCWRVALFAEAEVFAEVVRWLGRVPLLTPGVELERNDSSSRRQHGKHQSPAELITTRLFL